MCGPVREYNLLQRGIFALVVFFCTVVPCRGELPSPRVMSGIVFEDNFDDQENWNLSGQFEGRECSVGVCAGNWYPTGYNFFRSVPGTAGLSPVGQIRKLPGDLPDHTTGRGKVYLVHTQSIQGGTWPGDGIIGKYFGPTASFPELYVRMWVRTQTGWQNQIAQNSALKLFRVGNWRGVQNIFKWGEHTAPSLFFDLAAYHNGNANYIIAYRCDPSDYYCKKQNNNYQKVDRFEAWEKRHPPVKTYADGLWHRYDFHLRINRAGQYDGLFTFKYDGMLIYRKSDVAWLNAGSTVTGWNMLALGGNSNNTWAAKGEQWYAIDDFVVSTTPIPEDYTIHGKVD